MSISISIERPTVEGAHPSQHLDAHPSGVASPAPLTPSQSRLGTVIAVAGLGLLMIGVGDALARTGHQSPVVPLFLAGLTFIVVPCAWRLTGTAATRNERIWVSLVLGVGLLASYVFRSPLIFDGFDELAHGATLMRLLDSRSPFPTNPILPVSPFYPGIELLTISFKWLVGLPLLLDQMAVLIAARVVLVLCVFLIVERACLSSRAGGIGVLVYAASPEFYSQGAQYGYQTLAISFAVAVVYLLFLSIDEAQPRKGRLFALALVCLAAMVVSHHVTTWLTVGFLVVWAIGLRWAADTRVPSSSTAPFASGEEVGVVPPQRDGIGSQKWQLARRREQSRIIGLAALVGVVLAGLWIAFVGHLLTGYVGPIVEAGASNVVATLDQLHGNRELFQNSAGGGSPLWESMLMLAAAISWCLILLMALYSAIWKRTVRGGRLRYIPAVVAATYPLALLSNISSDAKLIGARATTFIFFGMAVVVGGWLARRTSTSRGVIVRMITIGVATVCFLGSTLYGGGPLPALIPGPYIVGAHERSLGAPSLALANWVASNLPAGSHIAADRDNAALLNDIGRVEPITPTNGTNSPAPLFFDRQITPSDVALIRRDDIRYIVTDTRLTEGLPLYGAYIAPGETRVPTLLTAAELEKFNSAPWVRRIYDNGPIQVYDLSLLAGKNPSPMSQSSPGAKADTGTNVLVLVMAFLVMAVWLVRLRRRAKLGRVHVHEVVCGMVGAMAIALFGTFAVVLLHLPSDPIAILTLVVLLLLGLRPLRWWMGSLRKIGRRSASSPTPAEPNVASETLAVTSTSTNGHGPDPSSPSQPASSRTRRARSQLALGCAGLVLVAIGASFATATAHTEWVPPPELSISFLQTDKAVASVNLGATTPVSARLAVVVAGHVLWSSPLSPHGANQSITIPAHLLHPGSRVVLIAKGTLREVDG